MRDTWPLLEQIAFPPIRRGRLDTLQVNLGYRCNQSCVHCHVNAGPNSNTFTATVLRAVPQLETTLPSNAVGKDFRPYPYLGLTDSGTGIEASLWGLLGVKVGWIEGIEVNFLGLVAGLDLRHPAVKLPGFGRVGIDDGTAVAAPAPAK